jgi:hypothetical protein
LIWFCSGVEAFCFYLEDLEQQLSHSQQGVHLVLNCRWSDLVLEGKPERIGVSYQLLYSRVATSEVG